MKMKRKIFLSALSCVLMSAGTLRAKTVTYGDQGIINSSDFLN